MTVHATSRRYDLDWLRILAFGLLIFYHVGMFYVTWGWHVKSEYASPAAEPIMVLINPWRLALLFLISGVAIRFATDKAVSLLHFAGQRLSRLGLPLVFGVLLWVMPQSYYEVRQSGEFTGSMLSFYPAYLSLHQQFSMVTPTWNHLWYLVYVLSYILILLPIMPLLHTISQNAVWRRFMQRPAAVVFVLIVPFALAETWLGPVYPTTHDLINDWANHAQRFLMFVLGFLIAKDPRFWESVDRVWKLAPVLIVLTWAGNHSGIGLATWAHQFVSDLPIRLLFNYTEVLYAWSCIVTLLGFGQRYLNQQSPILKYLTGAIFCYYVLHQTIIVVAGFYLTGERIGVAAEASLLLIITGAGCVLGYELLRRIPRVGIFFGISRASGFRP